jgi:hypothetical protein
MVSVQSEPSREMCLTSAGAELGHFRGKGADLT